MSTDKPAEQGLCYPTEVRRQAADQQMSVVWNDGHVSEYPWAYVRGWCPCATCQGHTSDKRYIHHDSADLTNVAVVGKYALSLTWSDGHDSGIYSYRYLRDLCGCSACAAAKAARS